MLKFIAIAPECSMTFKVIHVLGLPAFLNEIFHTPVQNVTRFQLQQTWRVTWSLYDSGAFL